jgi:hypothetical protein
MATLKANPSYSNTMSPPTAQPDQSMTLYRRALGLALALMFWTPATVLARPIQRQGNQQEQTAKAKTLPPAQYIPSHNYDTRHITLNLHFDWAQEQAIGTATITRPLVVNLRSLELDAPI